VSDRASGLNVYYRDQVCGRLSLDEARRFVFAYDPEWLGWPDAFPLSLSLSLRPEAYADDTARPFFANLLPEGELRRLIARQFHLSVENVYGLLERIGGDCAGAISIFPPQEKPDGRSGYRALDEEGLHHVLKELPMRPFLAGEEGIRLSLAGAQNKLPVYIERDTIFIAEGNSPSTHILKLPIPDFEGTVENEFFCMTLARGMGLPVPDVVIRRNRDILLVVTRYDRVKGPNGAVLRLHQEDFCQALGILPDQKYEAEGGPSLPDCFSIIKRYSIRPAKDQQALLGWVIFNFLIGNADAHAKNLSLMLTGPGPRLALFYDLLSTQVYPHLTGKLAMKIGGENRGDWLQWRHWERFADDVGLKGRYVKDRVRNMAARIAPIARTLSESVAENIRGASIVNQVVDLIQKQASRWL
jgi:serine/threonine-protein kinase HipA